jgi:uncharacterized membrane protein YeaQ/YmgE (transglycosylase-associated protein family)
MMSIIGTILIGFIVGLIARAVKPGDDKLGWIMTVVLGVAGSFMATYAGAALGLYKQGDRRGHLARDLRPRDEKIERPLRPAQYRSTSRLKVLQWRE